VLESSTPKPIDGQALMSVPQSIEAGDDLSRPSPESPLLRALRSLNEQVTRLVPDCLGISVSWTDSRVPFTLVASEPDIAVLDAVQYLGGSGPALEVVDRGLGVEADVESLLNRSSWDLYARATLARGVRTVLALPLTQHGRVTGIVTLHGATDHAFRGAHEELARVLSGWAPDAIRLVEAKRPGAWTEDGIRTLREEGAINRAVATIATTPGVDSVTAKERLDDAAARAGVSTAQVAVALLQAHG
jgi:GAF domain-containing protein